MLRNDYITAFLVGLCLIVLIYILIRIYNIHSYAPLSSTDLAAEMEADSTLKKFPQDTLKEKDLLTTTMATELNQQDKTPKTDSSHLEKKYLVVAGAFSSEKSAKIEVERIQQLGFQKAEVGFFNQRTIASVIVGRFHQQQAAIQLSTQLKKEYGIESYVHIKK